MAYIKPIKINIAPEVALRRALNTPAPGSDPPPPKKPTIKSAAKKKQQ